MAKERKRNITPADKQAAAKLKALWDAAVPKRKTEGRPLTQEIMAERLANAIGRGTQGLVSQYLNGYIALNYRALLAFADEVGFEPEEVRDDLPEQQFKVDVRKRENKTKPIDSAPLAPAQVQDLLQSIAVMQSLLAIALAESIPDAGMAFVEKIRRLEPRLRRGDHVTTLIEGLEHEFANQAARLQRAASRKPLGSTSRK